MIKQLKMKSLFQRDLTPDEFVIYNKVIKDIQNNTKNLINEIDSIIENYNPRNRFEVSFYLDRSRVIRSRKS